jgi:D-tyrosyl-tRNA(Tyr) deacylase
MRVVVQRVRSCRVVVAVEVVGEIDRGLLVLLGIRTGDTIDQVRWLADKVVNLRIFEDDEGKMNVSVADAAGGVLVVSQFTLYGECQKGRRPSFIDAARPEVAEPLYEAFANAIRLHGVPVATGRFGADMQVELINDGPVTLVLDTPSA